MYLKTLIAKVRERTDNESYGTNEGIRDKFIADALSEAQERLQSAVLTACPSYTGYDKQTTLQLVAGQREYDLPLDMWGGNTVRLVEYRRDAASDYFKLGYVTLEELTDSQGDPWQYSLIGNKLIVHPTPDSSNGSLRVTYPQRYPRLSFRLAQINGTPTTSIAVDNISDRAALDNLEPGELLTAVGLDGSVKDAGLVFLGVAGSTLTIASAPSLAADDDYLVIGGNHTTHTSLPEEGERAMVAFAAWKVLRLDASVEAQIAEAEYSAHERDYIFLCRRHLKDKRRIPRINKFWL